MERRQPLRRGGFKKPVRDDHPNEGPHLPCSRDHNGMDVPEHCRCGAKWPCALESEPPKLVRPQAQGAGFADLHLLGPMSTEGSSQPASTKQARPQPKPQSRAKKMQRRNDGPWRAEVMAYRGEVCVSCGDTSHVQADHIWPRSQQGPSHLMNGLPLCGEFSRNTPGGCHKAKTDGRMVIEFSWLTAEQVEWLAEVGWVAWDEDGKPHGRGWRHFGDRTVRPAG